MKKILLIMLLFACFAGSVQAELDFGQDFYRRNIRTRHSVSTNDPMFQFIGEVEGAFIGSTGFDVVYFAPGSTPASTEGFMWYDATGEVIKYRNASGTVTLAGLGPGDSGSLDDAYNSGFAIDVDGTAVTMTVSDGDNNAALIINANDSTNNANGIEVVVASSNTGAGLYVNGTSGTIDLLGDNFSMANTGILTQVGAVIGASHLVLENGEIIDNSTDDMILFNTGDEDLKIDFTTGTNTITFTANSTGATIFDFGDFVTLKDMSAITGLAEDFTISTTGNATGEDLILQQAGTGDNQVQILSSGTSNAAILLDTSSTGGVTISALDDLILSVASTAGDDDLTITQTGAQDASILLIAAGTGTDAISLAASAGGISITAVADVLLQVTSSTTADDMVIAQVGSSNSSILIQAAGIAVDAISLIASAGGVNIDTASTFDIDMDATGGKILLTATENAGNTINIEENGGSNGGINIYANQGAGASASGEHDASIQLHSDVGGIGLFTEGNIGDTIRIETAGGADEFITIINTLGTGSDAITITASAAGGDLNLNSLLGRIVIEAQENVANAIYIIADGGTTSTVQIFNDTGDTADSIALLSDVGGISLSCATIVKIEAGLCLNDVSTFADVDETPAVNGDSFFESGTSTETITDFDGTGIEEGQIIVIISKAAITYDVTGQGLVGGTTDLVTASGDITQWIYDGTDWYLLSWIDNAANQNDKG